jgi:disulfide bond formation protein DsbB
VTNQLTIGFPLSGTPTDLCHDSTTNQFLVTTQHGVYLADDTLAKLNRYTIVDAGYAVDLGRFGAGAFVDKGAVLAVGENKSYVAITPTDKADAGANFRFFLESFETFNEGSRSRFGTVRARMMYVMSAAYDPATKSTYTVTVPNNKVKKLVMSRFGPDMVLSEEFSPTLGADAGIALSGKRSLDEFYVTGAAIAGGRMYAISAAFNTLLTIDLETRSVTAARAIPGLARPVGIAVKGEELYILGESGRVWVVGRE